MCGFGNDGTPGFAILPEEKQAITLGIRERESQTTGEEESGSVYK